MADIVSINKIIDDNYVAHNNTRLHEWLESELGKLDSELYYQSGETFIVKTSYDSFGSITSSGKSIRLTVIVPKRLDNITSITASGNLTIRHADGGYICSGVSIITLADSINCYVGSSNAVGIELTLSAEQAAIYTDGFTNNCPLNVQLRSGFTLTFA